MRRCPFLTFVLIGVLIAPKSGKELRVELSEKADDTKKTIKKRASDARYDIDGVKDTIKDTITLYTVASIQDVEEENVFEREFDV